MRFIPRAKQYLYHFGQVFSEVYYCGDYRAYLHEQAKSVCLLECELEEIR